MKRIAQMNIYELTAVLDAVRDRAVELAEYEVAAKTRDAVQAARDVSLIRLGGFLIEKALGIDPLDDNTKDK